MSEPKLRVLSLGAGVQSTTLALMAAAGEIAPIDYAVFADTQAEPASVYEHLKKLQTFGVLPFPIVVVSKGSLRQEILDASAGKRGAWARPPLMLINPDGSDGMTRRQCTGDYKIDPIQKEVRRLAGIKPRSRGPRDVVVEQLIGISTDEAHRQKSAQFRWIRHVYPLIELRMSRRMCVEKLAAFGWTAPKSACTFCPYHSDTMWAEMKRDDPASFADAVTVDRALRSGKDFMLKGIPFLHRERRPLEEIDFDALTLSKRAQMSLFGEECDGVCGV